MSTSDKAFKAGMLKAERQKRVRDAAPQMLPALKKVEAIASTVEDRYSHEWTEAEETEFCRALETVRAAIRAAEGD